MLGMKVRVLPGKTIRIRTEACGTFNADFDGDELNIHVPQGEEAYAEIMGPSSFEEMCRSTQNGKSLIKICQDGISGGYRMTKGWVFLDKSSFFNLCMCLPHRDIFTRMEEIKEVYRWKGLAQNDVQASKLLYSGYGIFSMLLPNNLDYENQNKSLLIKKKKEDGTIVEEFEPVVIIRGVMISGQLNKDVLGQSFNSLLALLPSMYSNKICLDFCSDYGYIVDAFLLEKGFSIGLGDCLPPKDKIGSRKEQIDSAVIKSYLEAQLALQKEKNLEWKEMRILSSLNKAHDIGSVIAKKCLDQNNGLADAVLSGAKGNLTNITQIFAIVGQQNIEGRRVPKVFKGNLSELSKEAITRNRSLPHFLPDEVIVQKLSELDQQEGKEPEMMKLLEYLFLGGGFVSHSYIEGLSPAEFFYHAMSGRTAVAEHAVKVSASGYGERKMVKTMEDLKVSYTGTITNSRGTIVSFGYGGDGIDGGHLMGTKQGLSFINIGWWVNRLNTNLEYAKWTTNGEGKELKETRTKQADENQARLKIQKEKEKGEKEKKEKQKVEEENQRMENYNPPSPTYNAERSPSPVYQSTQEFVRESSETISNNQLTSSLSPPSKLEDSFTL